MNDKTIRGIQDLIKGYSDNSYALRIIKDNTILYEEVRGYENVETQSLITPNTNFRLASVSKQFTAASIMLLVQRELLSVTDPLVSFFPEFSHNYKSITIHHLLCHQSGLPDFENLIPADVEMVYDHDVLQLLQGTNTLVFSPGNQYSYNNGTYCLLRLIIEKVSGQKIDVFLQQEFFDPLDMSHTYVKTKSYVDIPNRAFGYSIINDVLTLTDQDRESHTVGDGGIYSSLVDLQKWVQVFNTDMILNQEIRNLMMEKHSVTKYAEGYFYGYGLYIKDDIHKHVFHGGSSMGFHTCLYNIFDEKFTIIYLSNRSGENGSDVVRGILDFININ